MTAIVGLVLIAGLATAPANATATTGDLDSLENVEAQLLERFEEFGVPDQSIPNLLQKWRDGKPFDSELGVEPTTSITQLVDGFRVTTERFPDGSVIKRSIEIPIEQTGKDSSVQSIEGCRFGAGAGNFPFFDCRVKTDTLLYDANFLVDGQTSSIGQASVRNPRDPQWLIVGSTVDSHTLTVLRSTQSGTTPAHAKLTLRASAIFGAGAQTYTLNFYVRDQTMWDTNVG